MEVNPAAPAALNRMAAILLGTTLPAGAEPPGVPEILIRADAPSLQAPHGRGNVYAPEIRRTGSGWQMWFGAQGRDGHDRIHLAVSADGISWKNLGVVLEDKAANHVNDPSVVEAGGRLFMYYTRAGSGVTDEIAVATSADGVHWEPRGTALPAGPPGSWDALSAGRPSVLFYDGRFHLWYDGRKDLPPGAPDPQAPKSPDSQRFAGYATSRDGFTWERRGSPVFAHDAGGLQVLRSGDRFIMVFESPGGTAAASSHDGIHWQSLGLPVPRSGSPDEAHGHVTPFLLPDADGGGATLYYGAAPAPSWNANRLTRRRFSGAQWQALKAAPPLPE